MPFYSNRRRSQSINYPYSQEPTAIAYKAVTAETLLEPDPHAYLYPFRNTAFLEQSRTGVAIMC